jgi:hypothetical protein
MANGFLHGTAARCPVSRRFRPGFLGFLRLFRINFFIRRLGAPIRCAARLESAIGNTSLPELVQVVACRFVRCFWLVHVQSSLSAHCVHGEPSVGTRAMPTFDLEQKPERFTPVTRSVVAFRPRMYGSLSTPVSQEACVRNFSSGARRPAQASSNDSSYGCERKEIWTGRNQARMMVSLGFIRNEPAAGRA